jgi:hypothetical protein
MREVSCHAMIEFLQLSAGDGGQEKLDRIVEEVVIKQLLTNSSEDKALVGKELIQSWTPEQISVALFIQKSFKNATKKSQQLLRCLNSPILSVEMIPFISEALISTSQSYPREHLVWSHVVAAVVPVDAVELTSLQIQTVVAIFEVVVEGGLLNTHERKALALTLLQGFATALPPAHLILLLRPKLCKLLLNTVVTGNKGKQHKLHRIGHEVLESIVSKATSKSTPKKMRLAVAERLLEVESRFDARTKTKTMYSLLSPSDSFGGLTLSDVLAFNQFLKTQILKHATSGAGDGTSMEVDDDEEAEKRLSIHDAGGYLGVLCGSLPRLVSNLKAAEKEAAVEDVLGFLMACAFFDCTKCADQKSPEKKRGKGTKSKNIPSDSFSKASIFIAESCSGSLPYSTQALCSEKFFSLLAECGSVAKSAISGGNESGEDLDPLTFKYNCLARASSGWTALENHGAVLARSTLDEDSRASRILTQESCDIVRSLEKTSKGDEQVLQKTRCAKSIASMVLTLSLQLLRCGESGGEARADDDDEDDLDEIISDVLPDIVDALRHLVGVNVDKIQKEEGEESQPANALVDLVDALIGALSISCNGKNRGASLRLFRDNVKACWSTTLSYVAVSSSSFDTSKAISALLDEVCGSTDEGESDDGGEESDADEESEDEDMSVDEEVVFSSEKAAEAIAESEDESETVPGENSNSLPGAESESEDVELDPAQLENLLLDDIDDNVHELEHHAGADHALAALIKLKQDSRKSAVQERERMEIARRIRCISLLDVLFSNKISNQLQSEDISACVVRLLKTRRDLEKTISSPVTNPGQEKVISETRSLLEKVTALLKSKVCKLKLAPLKTEEASLSLANAILEELKISFNAKQCDSCTAVLMFSVKLFAGEKERNYVANRLGNLAKEWGSDKSTKIHSMLFEESINRFPELACEALMGALADVVGDGRNAFVKFEALRLFSILVSSQSEEKVVESVKSQILPVLKAVTMLFNGDEGKTKRARDALKCTDNIVKFSKKHLPSDKATWECIRSLAPALNNVKDSSQSDAVKKTCDELISAIEMGVSDEEESVTKRKAGNINDSEKKLKKKKKKKSKK